MTCPLQTFPFLNSCKKTTSKLESSWKTYGSGAKQTCKACGALRGDHNMPFFNPCLFVTTADCQTQTRSTSNSHYRAGAADLGSYPRRQRNRVITSYNTVHTHKEV